MPDRLRLTHQLRGQIGTIGLCAAALDLEPDLTETGRLAVKRINEAIVRATHAIELVEESLPR